MTLEISALKNWNFSFFLECPSDWLDGGDLGRCFLFVRSQDLELSWTEANEYCEEQGGFLTDIPDQDTFNFISINMIDGGGWRWIGGSDIDNVNKINLCHFS